MVPLGSWPMGLGLKKGSWRYSWGARMVKLLAFPQNEDVWFPKRTTLNIRSNLPARILRLLIGCILLVACLSYCWNGARGKANPFTFHKAIDIGERLMTGEWLILLHHHDCGPMQEGSSCLRGLPSPIGRKRRLDRSSALWAVRDGGTPIRSPTVD